MRFFIFLVLSVLMLPTLEIQAQKGGGEEVEGPVGIFPSRSEYNQFMGSAKQAAYGEGGTPELQAMIPMLNDIALDKPVGWTANEYGTQRSTLGLLSQDDIRAELDMMDDQYEKLQELNQDIQDRAGRQIRELDFGDRENLVSNIRDIRERAQSDLDSVLLPHQLARLRQIRMQALLGRRSLVQILTNDPVKSDLEITDEQTDKLKDAELRINEKLEKKIAKLREEARKELIGTLAPKQRRQVEEMIGDAFDVSSLNQQNNRRAGRRANNRSKWNGAKGKGNGAKGDGGKGKGGGDQYGGKGGK